MEPQRSDQRRRQQDASSKQYETERTGAWSRVERNTSVTNRQGQTANWEGKAEREGGGWNSKAKATTATDNRSRPTATRREGRTGRGVVADVEGRTAWRPDRRRRPCLRRECAYAGTLPAGYRGYSYYGRPYYGYGGAYYRPYGSFYYPVAPPWGYCCYNNLISSERWR